MTEELPEGWAKATLARLTEPVPNVKPEAQPRLTFRYVDISAIDNTLHAIRRDDIKEFLGKDAPSRARRPIIPGDVLFSNVRTYLKNTALVKDQLDGDLCTTGFTLLRPTEGIDPQYLFRYVLSDAFVDAITPHQTGTHYPATSDSVVLAQEMAVPPLAEQRRIVERVEALLARVEAANQRLVTVPFILKRFRQSVLAAACSGKLTEDWRKRNISQPENPSAFRAPSNSLQDSGDHLEGEEIPEEWRVARVDALVSIQNGRAFPSTEYRDAGLRLVRPGNLHVSGRLEWSGDNTVCLPVSWGKEYPEFVLGSGELLMNLTAQSLKDQFLGRVCVKSDSGPALLNQRIARFIPHGSLDMRAFLFVYFRSKYFRSFVNGLDAGSLIRHMHSKDVARHLVPLPPCAEQAEIVRRVDALIRLADTIERRVAIAAGRADTLTQSILAKAFRGELVPTEAELARAEARNYESAGALLARVRSERAATVPRTSSRRRLSSSSCSRYSRSR